MLSLLLDNGGWMDGLLADREGFLLADIVERIALLWFIRALEGLQTFIEYARSQKIFGHTCLYEY